MPQRRTTAKRYTHATRESRANQTRLCCLGAALCIIGAGIGFGRIGAAALESMSRQPEVAGKVQTAMIIIAALLEGATFFALLICIQLAGKIAPNVGF